MNKEYVQLCEQAQFLQEEKTTYEVGDLLHREGNVYTIINVDEDELILHLKSQMTMHPASELDRKTLRIQGDERSRFTWLPRQEQLQSLLMKRSGFYRQVLRNNIAFAIENLVMELEIFTMQSTLDFTSFESLWLNYVASQIYFRRWDTMRSRWVGL